MRGYEHPGNHVPPAGEIEIVLGGVRFFAHSDAERATIIRTHAAAIAARPDATTEEREEAEAALASLPDLEPFEPAVIVTNTKARKKR